MIEIPDSLRPAATAGAPVFLLVNPIEYHGPHLSLRNDHLCSMGIAKDLHARLAKTHPEWPLIIAGELDIGVDPVPGPGSQHVAFPDAKREVRDACAHLVSLGVKRVVLLTFHGSPLHSLALEGGVELLREKGVQVFAPLNLLLKELLTVDGSRYADGFAPISDPVEREQAMRELPIDFHAGYFETSVALHYTPESVRPIYRELPPCPELHASRPVSALSRVAGLLGARSVSEELGLAATGLAWYALRPFPAYTGRPHLASAKAGAVFAEIMSSIFTPAAEEVFAGRAQSPRPIMGWLPRLSLGGRFGSPQVPVSEVLRFAEPLR